MCVRTAESSNVAVDLTWENSLSEALEKEVQDTRKMVSALQVHAYRCLSCSHSFFKNIVSSFS